MTVRVLAALLVIGLLLLVATVGVPFRGGKAQRVEEEFGLAEEISADAAVARE